MGSSDTQAALLLLTEEAVRPMDPKVMFQVYGIAVLPDCSNKIPYSGQCIQLCIHNTNLFLMVWKARKSKTKRVADSRMMRGSFPDS